MNVLVAEDDPVSRRILQALLKKWGHETVIVDNGLDALALLESGEAPKLVLLDWEMPGMDGLEVCRRIRSTENPSPPYIIFITAKDSSVDMVRGLEAGASDFIRKPFQREELRARIDVGRRTLELQDELLQAKAQMERLAMYDPLTGTYNRRAIMELINQELSRLRRENSFLALGIIDIDHFKKINDLHGHHAGDAALVEFAKTTRVSIRRYDTLSRWGGEEFLVLAPYRKGMPEKPIVNPVFERVRTAAEEMVVTVDGREIRLTVSAGVAVTSGNEEAEEIIQRADRALYQAKETGRNRVVLAPIPEPPGTHEEPLKESLPQ